MGLYNCMVTYINTHLNAVHILVDGSLRKIESGEQFESKSPIGYDCIKPVFETPKSKRKIKNDNSTAKTKNNPVR